MKRKQVFRDVPEVIEARPLLPGDVVRDASFPTYLSVFSHYADGKAWFSEGDNWWPIGLLVYLRHADGAPIALPISGGVA